jgi:hypothetical protein
VLAPSRTGPDLGAPRDVEPRRSATPAWAYLAAGTVAIIVIVVGPAWLQLPLMLLIVVGGLWGLT